MNHNHVPGFGPAPPQETQYAETQAQLPRSLGISVVRRVGTHPPLLPGFPRNFLADLPASMGRRKPPLLTTRVVVVTLSR